jgi:iron complex outermembrane receptor protein
VKRTIAVILGAAVCAPPLAVAQEQHESGVEEVLVTAQRRVESVQDVPISVSVFTAADLEKSNINEAKDYLAFAPNVSFTEDGEVGNRGINISIRGVSDVSLGEVVTANSIGFYLDEFNVGTVANGVINPQLRDVERIEVLRGPQGTYFGRNALAGALNITTKKPEQTFSAEGSVRASRFSTWGLGGVLNVPLSDTVAARLVADYDESDGLVKNVNPDGRSNSGYKDKYARLGVRATPSDALTVDLSLIYSDENDGFDAEVPSGVLDLDTQSIFGSTFRPIDDQLGLYPDNQRRVNHDAAEYNNNTYKLANLRFSYDLGGMELHSITGYIESDNSRFFDQDNISVDAIVRQNRYSGKSYSQELRLQSTGESRAQWTFGALYARDEIDQFNSIRAGAEGSYTDPVTGEVIGLLPPIPAGFRINENRYAFRTTAYAAFGDISWKLTDLWTLKTGVRYTHDKVSNRLFDVVAFESPPSAGEGSDSFNDLAPRVVLQYEPTADATWYLTASKG